MPHSIIKIEHFRKESKIILFGNNILPPILEYFEICFPIEILNRLKDLGYIKPTPIQAQSLPIILSGKFIII